MAGLATGWMTATLPAHGAQPTAPASPESPTGEKEYYDATVLLINPKDGMLGVNHVDEKTQQNERLSFQVDLKEVLVTNQFNQSLEFSEIAVGDRVDIFTEKGRGGKDNVTTIVDYNKFEPE